MNNLTPLTANAMFESNYALDRPKFGNGNKTTASVADVTMPNPRLDGSRLLRVQLPVAEQSSTYLTHREESLQAPAVVLKAGFAQAIERDHFHQL